MAGYEWGGWITEDNENYSYTEPSTSESRNNVNLGSKPDDAVAFYHSHTINGNFSGGPAGDTGMAQRLNVDAIVVMPDGEVRYYNHRLDKDFKVGDTGKKYCEE